MAATTTLLDKLRSLGQVDCDTFDVEVAKELGPFVDCTSNQAIAYHELIRITADSLPSATNGTDPAETRVHEELIRDSVGFARKLLAGGGDEKAGETPRELYSSVGEAELAVEVMMVKLALRIVPCLTGYSHIQTNPKYSYDVERTVQNARRIIHLFTLLAPSSYDARKRVCIKIPATWEGMQACRTLESAPHNIATLATTMFCKEQALLAAHAGCTYIAPYINELRVHFDPGFVDEAKAFTFSATAQAYYDVGRPDIKTQVLPASLTSIQEVMMLAGSHHITVSPPLLKKLAETPADPWADAGLTGSVMATAEVKDAARKWGGLQEGGNKGMLEGEKAWKDAFAASMDGKAKAKIVQAVDIFCEKQEGLEGIARSVAEAL